MDKADRNKEENYGLERVELLNRELKYTGSVLHVYEDTVKVMGHEAKWDYIHHIGAAAIVPVLEDGRIVMVRQFRHALDRFTLEIPAGKRDYEGEPLLDCALRELHEEAGFVGSEAEYLMTVNTTVAFCDEEIGIYVCRNLKKAEQNLDPDEEINIELWELEDLKQKIFAGEMTDGKTVAAILAYDAKYCR
ncbi:MAG: NUDIX hydrolase [Bacillota bacterium]|nr:NUDIX hydrolase [Clostridium sp.]MDT3843043.1 NUDIX hydrolase [Bacillota bacterium]